MWWLLVRKSIALVCSVGEVRVVQREGAAYVVVLGFGLMVIVLGLLEGVFDGMQMPLSLRSMVVVFVLV